ncbi:MAG: ribose-5-phosphate isomerase RpiA, partial [Chloroflexota bacterium]
MDAITEQKKLAGERAVDAVVTPGSVVGLGSGSTAVWAVRRIAERLDAGDLTDVVGIPTSIRTADEAKRLGIPLTTLEETPLVDVTIDGADEIDPRLNVIKGGGGALLREKIVASASAKLVIVADGSKLSDQLGLIFKLPVEVIPFGLGVVLPQLAALGCTPTVRVREGSERYMTDNGNLIADCAFAAGIADVHATSQAL